MVSSPIKRSCGNRRLSPLAAADTCFSCSCPLVRSLGEEGGWGGLASKSFYSPSLRGKSDLGNGQTDGQETLGGRRERRENNEFSRSIIPTHGSGHHCDLQGDHEGYRGKEATSQNG